MKNNGGCFRPMIRKILFALAILFLFSPAVHALDNVLPPGRPGGFRNLSPAMVSPMLTPMLPGQPGALPGATPREKAAETELAPLPPAREPASEFEQFVSGTVELTDVQFAILQHDTRLRFSPRYKAPEEGELSVPVRVLRAPVGDKADPKHGRDEVAIGFLLGPRDLVAEAFLLLGVRSRYAITRELRQFGYDLFLADPSTFAPSENVPVGPDYVVGPGDGIRVDVWGTIDGQFDLTVDRDGQVAIPRVGVVGVGGLTFAELKEVLHKAFSRYYTGFEMNVSMGALRSIRVYIVGNARRPGAYTVSSLSTLVNGLFVSGGPAKSGSMRNIQVKRGGDVVARFDLYDFLLKGDKTKDIRLMPEDVVFIPPIGPVVAIAGSVYTPALYELDGEHGIRDLVHLAGGLTPVASRGRVRIERIERGTRQVVLESDLERVDEKEVPVHNGDVVTIFPVFLDPRVVRIAGAVQREGEFGIGAGLSVRDLLSLAGGPKYYASRKEAELTRVSVTDAGPKTETVRLDLERALAGDPSHNLELRENDYLFVRTVPDWRLYRTVTVSGEVRYPGTYTIQKGERLSSLIERVGGFTEKGYLRGATFTRERVRELQQAQIDDMVERLEREITARIALSVATALSPEEARIREIEAKQMTAFVDKLKQARARGRMVVAVGEPAELRGRPGDVELEDGDVLHIPSNPGSVQVAGSVFNQTAFVYDPKRDIDQYIEMAGGSTATADEKKIYVLKVDGSAIRGAKKGWFGISWGWGAAGPPLDPGDTIVVPEDLERIAWLREIRDITTILFQVAVAAGVVVALF
jgi:polysaccharide biosynthesis/export protein